MSKRKWTNEQFILAVETSLSYAEVIRKLGLKPAGGNYDTVKRKIKELDLIENLQLLCPNCHALTDNYRGKNIKQVA